MSSAGPAGIVRRPEDVPGETAEGDTVTELRLVDAPEHAEPLTCRLLRCESGRSLVRRRTLDDELLYVVAGEGTLSLDVRSFGLVPGTAALVLAGEAWQLAVPDRGALVVVAVRVPAPPGPWGSALARPSSSRLYTTSLGGQDREEATSGREFELLFNPARGSRGATQFVGFIPASGAPAHYHLYDEICVILRGRGLLRVADRPAQPLTEGAAFAVTPRLLHSLENTGEGDLWLLGVFRPAGSAAAAYYPDGRPAPNNVDD